MISFEPHHYFLSKDLLQKTGEFMQRLGRERREAYVWWGGLKHEDGTAEIMNPYFLDIPSEFGRVQLGVKELSKLHTDLRAHGEILLAELHTHPPGANGQNYVDAHNPALTQEGFLTIVVPNFGLPDFNYIWRTYVYRYIKNYRWLQLSEAEAEILLHVR